jgi:hypothetical protein
MASHSVEFSEVLPHLREEEETWLRDQLMKIYVFGDQEYLADELPDDLNPDEADWYGPRFLRGLADEPADSRGFEYQFRDAEPQGDGLHWGRHLWFYADQQGDPDSLALLVQKFLARFRPHDSWEFSCAYGCSKLCAGAFGGDSYFITADDIQCASDLLERAKQKSRPRKHREDGQQTATLTVDVDYNPAITDPESLAAALDTLLQTALSTPGILEDYGNPVVGEFLAPRDHVAYVIAEMRNRGRR